MLGKCANPMCFASFRKLGSGKLFAFESVVTAKSVGITSNPGGAKTGRAPVFFWLCELCSLTFTLGRDAAGQLTLDRIRDGARISVFDRSPLDQAG
jgi:hypothetical protein